MPPGSRGPVDLEKLAVNAIRILSMEAVERAKSGHPGLSMGCADIAYVLFTRFLKFNPEDPRWPDNRHFEGTGMPSDVRKLLVRVNDELTMDAGSRFEIRDEGGRTWRQVGNQGTGRLGPWRMPARTHGSVPP